MDENVNHGGEKSPVAAAVLGAELAPTVPPDIDLAWERCNDLGNMRRFLARHAHDLAYVEELGWLVWNGKRWDSVHGKAAVEKKAHDTVERIYDESKALEKRASAKNKSRDLDKTKTSADDVSRAEALAKHAGKSCSSGSVDSMIKMTRPYLTRDADEFDQEEWVITVNNGFLSVGPDDDIELNYWRRDHFNTRLAPVDYIPKALCPRWRRQMEETLPDEDTARYFQKWMGYSIVGDISHQQVVFLSGRGSNGKSTLLEVICEIIGDYATTTGIETFLYDKNRSGSAPSPDVARLRGARLVRTSEPEAGVRMSESRLKVWTGGERMTARELNKGFFEFRPTGKLTISVNIKPTIVGKDDGIRRRIKVIPFKRQFGIHNDKGELKQGSAPKKNQAQLVADLLEERSGIFNWLLDGLSMVLEEGLDAPKEVLDATRDYFIEQNPIGQFLDDCTDKVNNYKQGCGFGEIRGDVLYDVYAEWCDGVGETVKNKTAFGRYLSDEEYSKRASNGKIWRGGLDFKSDWVPKSKRTYANKDDE